MKYALFLSSICFLGFLHGMQELCRKELNPELIKAVQRRNLEKIAQLLKAQDFHPQQKDKKGNSLLLYVASPSINKEIYPLAKQYLDLKCKENSSKQEKKECIEKALSLERTLKVIKMLVKFGIDPKESSTLLNQIIFFDAKEYLMENNSEIYGSTFPKFWNSFYSKSRYRILKKFFKYGADPNLSDEYGNTTCHYIAYDQYPNDVPYNESIFSVVRLLYEYGADFGKKNKHGNNAFHIEACKIKPKIAEVLLPSREEKYILITLLMSNKKKAKLPKPILFYIIKLFFPLIIKFPLLDKDRIRTHKELLQITDKNGKMPYAIALEKHCERIDQIRKECYFDGITFKRLGYSVNSHCYSNWSDLLNPDNYI